jgi:hypothetical protein
MSNFDPSILDLTPYRTLPTLTATGSLALASSLVDRQPADIPDYVSKAALRMIDAVGLLEQALTERLDRRADLGLERSFDVLVDRVWIGLRSHLEFWQLYEHEGIELLSPELQAEADVTKARELATIARELLDRLFGDGVDFLQLSYPEQAMHMAARLRYVESRGLDETLTVLVGARASTLVRVCQHRYEMMVAERSGREGGVMIDLRPLHAKLRGAVENYASLLLTTLYDRDEKWAQLVFAALRPIPVARQSVHRPAAEGQDDGPSDAVDGGGVGEQAVVVESE